MNGLRVFIKPDQKGLVEYNVFYCQRDHGPVYRWHYEKYLGRWNTVCRILRTLKNRARVSKAKSLHIIRGELLSKHRKLNRII